MNPKCAKTSVVYMFPNSQKLVNKKDDYIKICGLLNALYLNNTISFKYLNKKNIYFLENRSFQCP